METWVLIPAELSLVLQQHVQHQARVWTRVPVAQGRRWSPFQGTVRLGVMPSIGSTIDALDSEVRKPLKYLFYLKKKKERKQTTAVRYLMSKECGNVGWSPLAFVGVALSYL